MKSYWPILCLPIVWWIFSIHHTSYFIHIFLIPDTRLYSVWCDINYHIIQKSDVQLTTYANLIVLLLKLFIQCYIHVKVSFRIILRHNYIPINNTYWHHARQKYRYVNNISNPHQKRYAPITNTWELGSNHKNGSHVILLYIYILINLSSSFEKLNTAAEILCKLFSK